MMQRLEWYLVYTKPRAEDGVERKLADAGFEVLNPKLKERKIVRRKLKDSVAPLFPCYVFVRFDIYKHFRLVKYTRGVNKLVGSESAPTPVSDEIVSSLIRRTEGGFVRIRESFEAGETVSIKAGPFEGFDAVFEKEVKETERVSILLKSVNARVVVDKALLKKIS